MGSTAACKVCGSDFTLTSAHKTRCGACQDAHEADRRADYARRKPQTTVKRKHHDRKFFGGNRRAAIERDGGKCVRCGSTHRLHVHHKDGRGRGFAPEEQNNALDNLITLCGNCHQQLHAATEKLVYERHRDTVFEALESFLHSTCPPQA